MIVNETLFCSGLLSDQLEAVFAGKIEEVKFVPESEIAKSTDQQIAEKILSSFKLAPLEVFEDSMERSEPQEVTIDVTGRFDYGSSGDGERIITPGVRFTFSLPYKGSCWLWQFQPSTSMSVFPRGKAIPGENDLGTLEIIVEHPSNSPAERFTKELDDNLKYINSYIQWQRTEINNSLPALSSRLTNAVAERRKRLNSHSAIAQALNIPEKKKPRS